MAFLIRNIIEYNLLAGAKIVAGEKGINNEILWVNLMEILDALDSLQKGELLITTGYKIDNEDQYKDIILRLKNRGLCGIAIQTGYYIDEIPQYIKDAANKYDFPVIELPPNLTFSHIMHVLLENINLQLNLHNDSDFINLRNKLNHIVHNTNNSINKMVQSKSDSNSNVYLFLASASYINNLRASSIILESIDKIKAYFISRSNEVEIEFSGEQILFIVSLKEDVLFQDVTYDISKILNTISEQFQINFLIGSSILQSIDNLLAAFNDAIASQQILKKIGVKKGICSYNDINLFKLFEIVHYSNYSTKFAYETLKPIIDYDMLHKSSYLETLKIYLANECNITDTANKLFIHRHTLKNRLNKIGELCGVNFKNYNSRMSFSIAIFIYDYFIT
ncbi:transcriptional regulator [Clostridium polyendosporum]|uniref:Transcriptional regulator n=1 Tax=Clostridium polyendosporum TaxID=69208 RepID=A0A919VG54_9CLOT|nr:PucR family transcriptional regulator [Clostridium polyendosporum]GIM28847.1 transcriptional regulator [Clostridium polyendosporum]